MFQNTIDLLRGQDRKAAKAALKRELKALEEADIESQLDQLQLCADEQRVEELQKAETEKRERARLNQLKAARKQLRQASEALDAAVAELETRFHEIEEALASIAKNSGNGRVNAIRLRWLLVGAMWHGAKGFSTRLGIARTPGGKHKWGLIKD